MNEITKKKLYVVIKCTYIILHCRLHSLHVLIHIEPLVDVLNGSLEVEELDILPHLIMHLGNIWLIKNILCVSGKNLNASKQ